MAKKEKIDVVYVGVFPFVFIKNAKKYVEIVEVQQYVITIFVKLVALHVRVVHYVNTIDIDIIVEIVEHYVHTKNLGDTVLFVKEILYVCIL